jgi:hypothetical protein
MFLIFGILVLIKKIISRKVEDFRTNYCYVTAFSVSDFNGIKNKNNTMTNENSSNNVIILSEENFSKDDFFRTNFLTYSLPLLFYVPKHNFCKFAFRLLLCFLEFSNIFQFLLRIE